MSETKLAEAQYTIWDVYGYKGKSTTWAPDDVDKLEALDFKEYHKIVDQCRFYYRRDPIAGTVLNKLVEIGITDLKYEKRNLSPNELRIFEGVKDKLQSFIRNCALEYLISGLVVPEIKYTAVNKDTLNSWGIKKYTSLTLPTSMWIRDPAHIKINTTMMSDKPSYYVLLPDELIQFIRNGGIYPDGNKDLELYAYLLATYPEFVAQVKNGAREVLLDNDLIARRKVLVDSPYPTPYLSNSIESLKHKRNLRRMDYSVAARVISAIQLIKLGNDEFPVTEDDEDAFTAIKNQMTWRNSYGRDIERIFQLFANHTLTVEWVFPPVDVLLDDAKYAEVNQDIFVGLGFPRILTTGETLRTQTSDPEFATLSPIETMKAVQKDLLPIAQAVMRDIAIKNGIKDYPYVKFSSIDLHSFTDFVNAMNSLYQSGNISRTTYDKVFGFDWEEEMNQKEFEEKMIKELDLPEFAPVPFADKPEQQGNKPPSKPATDTNKPKEKPKSE